MRNASEISGRQKTVVLTNDMRSHGLVDMQEGL